MKVVPLTIELAIHYCCSIDDFPRRGAPAVEDQIRELLELGLLVDDRPNKRLRASRGLQLWLSTLCEVPLPVRAWKLPGRVEQDRFVLTEPGVEA